MIISKEMTVMEVRLAMKDAGWESKDRLSTLGWGEKYGYSIWFERWDWHGTKLGMPVSVHSHTDNLQEIDRVVYETAIRALKGWEEFKDTVPTQMVDGTLRPDTVLSEAFRKGRVNKISREDSYYKIREKKQ